MKSMVRRVGAMGAASVLAGTVAVVGGTGSAQAVTPSDLTMVAKITGRESINKTDKRWGVVATDLGVLWDTGRGSMLIAFGDTYGEGWGGNGGGPAEADWRCQVMAESRDRTPRNGIRFTRMMTDRPGHAKQLIPCEKQDNVEVTTIPTAGVSVGGRDYFHFMSVEHWGEPGYWDTGYSGLAYSDDGGRNWQEATDAVWPGDSRFAQAAFVKRGGYVYMYGTPSGRHGALYLSRVRASHVLDVDRYEYWNGDGWAKGDESAAAEVVSQPVGEVSVAYNAELRKWLMVYLNEDKGQIVLRSSPSLTGTWSDESTLVRNVEYPGLYGGFIYPWASHDDDLYFLMSQWEPYNTYLMKAELR